MTGASADRDSVLAPGASALVVQEDGELSQVLADRVKDAEVLRLVQHLAAVLILSSDADWVEETLSRLDNERLN